MQHGPRLVSNEPIKSAKSTAVKKKWLGDLQSEPEREEKGCVTLDKNYDCCGCRRRTWRTQGSDGGWLA